MREITNQLYHGIFSVIILLIILFSLPVYAEKPVIAVTGVKAETLKVIQISGMLENQLVNVINSTGIYDIINPGLLKDQLSRFDCTGEDCLLGFAKTADIDIIIKGNIEDKGGSLIINIISYGINVPYYGNVVYNYRSEVSIAGLNLSTSEYNFIAEEHAGYFISGLMRKYKSQLFVKSIEGRYYIDSEEKISGVYDLYRYDISPSAGEAIRLYKQAGKINIISNEIKAVSPGFVPAERDFIFITHSRKADFIDDLFAGRKRELVFGNGSFTDTSVLFFATVPISAMMPVAAPVGHYRSGDFTGLSLWALNAMPYLYLEYSGLVNRINYFDDDRDRKSREALARYRFGLYMLLCGGLSLTVDAFSGNMLHLASGYQGQQPYMGNNFTAVYFSLISGGGGLFYKGYRPEGYIYFHLNNILMYMCIKEFTDGKRNASGSGAHITEHGDRKKARIYLGALGALKILEVTHVLLLKDNIRSGKVIEEASGFGPAIYFDDMGAIIGAQYTVRY